MLVELICRASGWAILFVLPHGRPNIPLLSRILQRARVPFVTDDETGQKLTYKHRDLPYDTPLSEIAAIVQPLLVKLCASMK
jgi:hypothetical protein